jgi:transcriptional regulator with XRE-family HTH domain
VSTVGERVKEERLMRGWSQRDLAQEAKTTAETVSSIETGQHQARPSTLRKLAGALGLEVADFFREPALPKGSAPETGQDSPGGRVERRTATVSGSPGSVGATVTFSREPTEEELDELRKLYPDLFNAPDPEARRTTQVSSERTVVYDVYAALVLVDEAVEALAAAAKEPEDRAKIENMREKVRAVREKVPA